MPTGPEHYREAERLAEGLKTDDGAVYVDEGNEQVLAVAQVHATLALAAATALAAMSTRASTRTIRQWHDVAGSGRQMEDDL